MPVKDHRAALLGCLALLAPVAARAETHSADAILKSCDDAASNYKDLSLESKMKIFEPNTDKPAKELRFTTLIKGDKRLIRFLEPSDLRSMGMLIESRDVMYAFLPGFQRVRRLGTHMKNQTLFGSDVSNDEMAANTYSGVYAPKLVGEEGDNWVLELSLNAGKEAEYPRMKIWFDKKIKQPTKIECFDAAGKNVVTQTRLNYSKDQGDAEHYTPGVIRFVDHRRNDHRTDIENVNAKVNQGLADDLFSQRSLVRGQ
jgi:outer membrane lipoprotein-sorting protein